MLPPVLLLTAGLGTRLRPLSYLLAKPALPVAGEPLVQRILRWLAEQGAQDVVLNLHHRPETVAAAAGDGRPLGLRVRYSWEQPVLGSAGGPARAFSLVESDELLIVNGDTLTDVDLPALCDAHRRTDALVTLALVAHPRPERYGGVQMDERGCLTAFTPRGHRPPGWHFVGVQVVTREAYAGVPADRASESIAAHYPALMRQRTGAVRGWASAAGFDDIGTPREYLETSIRMARSAPSALVDPTAHVAASARIERTIVWRDASVEEQVQLSDCIVATGVCVRRGSRYHRAMLLPADRAPAGPQDRIERDVLVSPIAA